MKKTLIASAIAAATLSTGAFAEGTTISGSLEVAYTNVDMGDAGPTNGVDDNGSTIAFAHDHKISEEVTGFAHAEFAFDVDDGGRGDGTALDGLNGVDTAFVGVKGGFGEAKYGVDDTVYDWMDVVDTSEAVGLGGGIANTKDHEFIQYVSPEIGGGLTFGVTWPVEDDATFGGALAAQYSADNLTVALAYALAREEQGVDGQDTVGLGVSFGMDDLTLLAQFESESESTSGADDDNTYLALQGVYAMGQNQFALGYAMTSFGADGAEDQADIYLQALHNVSDHMYLYLEYLMTTDEGGVADADTDTLALGATYTF